MKRKNFIGLQGDIKALPIHFLYMEKEKAQKELGLVSGEELEKLNLQIEELQQNLKEAHEAKERAISNSNTKNYIRCHY